MGVLKVLVNGLLWIQKQDQNADFYTEAWYAKWLETSRRLNQMVVEQLWLKKRRTREQRKLAGWFKKLKKHNELLNIKRR